MSSGNEYGLTQETVRFYREAVRYGYSWSKAMSDLKSLYVHNKSFHLSKENHNAN